MMKNMQGFLKQAQEMQRRIEDVQTKLSAAEFIGKAGGGLVQITISGKSDMKSVAIDPSLLKVEEKEVLEDLIIAAFNDAKSQSEKTFADQMQSVTGGVLPAGFKLPI